MSNVETDQQGARPAPAADEEQEVELASSRLGTQAYWDSVYE